MCRSLSISCVLHLAALNCGGKPAVTGFVTDACGEDAPARFELQGNGPVKAVMPQLGNNAESPSVNSIYYLSHVGNGESCGGLYAGCCRGVASQS